MLPVVHNCTDLTDASDCGVQDLLNRSVSGEPLPWYKTLHSYYHRPEWELYDLKRDPSELHNLADKPSQQVSPTNGCSLLTPPQLEWVGMRFALCMPRACACCQCG